MNSGRLLAVGSGMHSEDVEGTCRVMETRQCPPSWVCGSVCARFESEDETPWIPNEGNVRQPLVAEQTLAKTRKDACWFRLRALYRYVQRKRVNREDPNAD